MSMLLLFTACAKPPEPAARAPVRQLVMPLLEASDDDMFGCQSAADCVGSSVIEGRCRLTTSY
ncbi:MAG: hypothetical protein Q8K32_04425 [Archangium sp.]|nr:hypothetical protein [Archangium sp.]